MVALLTFIIGLLLGILAATMLYAWVYFERFEEALKESTDVVTINNVALDTIENLLEKTES